MNFLKCLMLTIGSVLFLGGVSLSAKPQYKVLVLGPIGSRSLYHLTKSLSEALGEAGHSVTLVSTFGPSSTHSNVVEIPTGAPAEILENLAVFENKDSSLIFKWHVDVTKTIGQTMWNNEDIKRLWEKRKEFDAIVIISYANEIAVPFLLDYEGAYINLCTPGIEFKTMGMQGNWLPLSVIPSILLPFDEYMTFSERLINPWATLLIGLYGNLLMPSIQDTVQNYFPQMPPIKSLYANPQLTLINGHFAMDGPMPLLPTQVEIGTINAKPPKPLPKDLESFVEASGDDGVIYFSLGSIIKGKDMPYKYKRLFLEAFKRIPQRVIWKFEGELQDLPTNVLTRSWLPQQDILGHPKTRLFISHCGNLGTQEAKYHGVPVLAIPLAVDQPRNAARMARKGYGLVLEWEKLTTEALVNAIQTLLNDPSYAARLKEVSEALKDQKESPAERAVWWVEYTIRHNKKNSTHLRYAGRNLHYLQYVMVDVVVFWLLVLVLCIMIWVYIFAKIWKWCWSSKDSKKKKD